MATTTNYSWVTPDDTSLVKDGASAIRTLGSSIDTTVFNNASAAIAKTIVDAKGDIIAATAADTVSRLAVGANDTVLTADSTAATGLKWAATSSGAYTSISNANLTGTTLTISSIPATYKDLLLIINAPTSTANSAVSLRINGLTSANYQYAAINSGSATVAQNSAVTEWGSTGVRANTAATNDNCAFYFPNYATTVGHITGFFNLHANAGSKFGTLAYVGTGAISSITIFTAAVSTFNGGNYTLYGVK